MRDAEGSRPWRVEELRGCLGAFTMDDGGRLREVLRSGSAGTDLRAIGAEMAVVLKEAQQAAVDLALDPIRAVSVRSDGPTLIIQVCGQGRVLVAAIDRAASAAMARRALAEAARTGATSP